MADRFDKFTERARRVLSLAQEEAQRFNHNYIGTEHLLLGLVGGELERGHRRHQVGGAGLLGLFSRGQRCAATWAHGGSCVCEWKT